MERRKSGLPNLKLSTTILVLLLLVINSLPVAPASATPTASPTAAVSSGAAHDMSKMDMSMPGMTMDMDMEGMDGMDMPYSIAPGAASLSAISRSSLPVTVTVSNFTFTPITQTVSVGTTVNWNWAGGFHSVTGDTGAFSSIVTSTTGVNFSFTFTQPGTYYYHCSVHGAAGNGSQRGTGMSGVIVVVAPPTISSLFPPANTAGNSDFDLMVKGSNFTASSTVKFGTDTITSPTFVDSTTLIARISAADIGVSAVGNVPVIVSNSGTDSGSVDFEVSGTCLANVITKTTAGITCGEFRNAFTTSSDIYFALEQGDIVTLGSNVLTPPNHPENITGLCNGSGPAIKLDVSAITGGFTLGGPLNIDGLEFLSSGTNGLAVLTATAPTGPNSLKCSKVTRS